ncbi:MAG: hypothetical protein LUH04_17865 [Clostridium sp.]|nr:hypothetical protein [Clostridium sp.]
MRRYLLCLGAAVLMAAALPVSAYGFTDTGRQESAPGDIDFEELERELKEMMGNGEEAGSPDVDVQPDVSEELIRQMAQMQSVLPPALAESWDGDRSMLIYTLPNDSSFSSSVPNGMVTTLPVTFLPMENARVTVSRSGIKINPEENGVYSKPGNYRFDLLVLPGAGQSGDNSLYEVEFYFRIIPSRSSQINLLQAPEGFYIDRLERDHTAFKPENPGWHFLSQDGEYRVRFVHEKMADVAFETAFIRDTKAPLLSFDPVPDRYEMKRIIHVEVDDPKALIEMYYNGSPTDKALKTLEIGGNYQYHLTDSAGNERYYAVKLADRFRMPGPGTIMITFLGLAGAAAWLIYQRRHPRFL